VKTTSRRRLRKAPLLFVAAISVLLLTAGLAAAGASALAAPAAPAAPAATVSAMAPNLMAVHGATVQVGPRFTCESGYGGWKVDVDGVSYWLWIGTDEGAYVVTDTTQGSCWHAPDTDDNGEIYNEAGDCLQWNAGTGVNFMATCNDSTPQQWTTVPSGHGSDYFVNTWAYDHGKSADWLNQYEPVEDSVTDLEVPTDDAAESWIHADCSSTCG
jgi:hypothetical protein